MAKREPKPAVDNDLLIEEFFGDICLIGVMAPMRGYQFCGELNVTFRMKFELSNEIRIQLIRKKRDYFFDVYEYHEPTGTLSYFVYNNKSEGEYLLPELRHFDYLLMMKGDVVSGDQLEQTMNVLKVINGVQLVTTITHDKIEKKENLVF